MKNFNADYGLLVSWSGFKSSVINEIAKQFFEIRLWTHKEIMYTVNHKYQRIFLTAVPGGRFTHLLFLFCSGRFPAAAQTMEADLP